LWSFGVIMYEMLSGEVRTVVFPNSSDFSHSVRMRSKVTLFRLTILPG
jgi:serine/threonine protein kinase